MWQYGLMSLTGKMRIQNLLSQFFSAFICCVLTAAFGNAIFLSWPRNLRINGHLLLNSEKVVIFWLLYHTFRDDSSSLELLFTLKSKC